MKPEAIPRNTVAPILARQRTIVCVGAGGVGKTTLAAAIAVQTARAGRRVACLTIDPARRLADSLGVTSGKSGQKIQDITEMLGDHIYPGGRLSFGMLDPKETFAEIVRMRASSPEAAERILKNKLYRYVSGSLSGMQEYMALEQLAAIQDDPEVELIVLDTPPTVNAIDFFTAPERMMEALDGRLVRMMRRVYGGTKRSPFDIWGRWTSMVLKALTRFTGTELLNEIMGFIDALSDLFGSFSERASAVKEVLRGSEIAFCLVTTPDKATLRETHDFRNRLSRLGLTVDAVIFNRAHWPRVDAGLAPSELDADLTDQVRRLNEDWNAAHDLETAFIERVRKAWHGLESVVVVPLLPEGATRVASLDRIGDYL
ncbi:MAG: ArsA family ATPase [Deltaproteobacteria bacterium]|nr:ArsA family ATPase [Deltaproteobacteria bacterium]